MHHFLNGFAQAVVVFVTEEYCHLVGATLIAQDLYP